ncbi:MAG: aspartate--tRNA ligase [Candidatus Marinimicrobia bacterium]|nr:aspartate--tRNA ligase [Candidatus Neomarinimicrobiota bacterium]
MKRIYISKTTQEKEAKINGWVDARRDHGKLIFIDVVDKSGILQVVFTPENKEVLEQANALRPNDVVEIEGIINERPANMIKEDIETGKIEMQAKVLKILNQSKTPPFEINTDGRDVNEEIRLKYRYIDLKRKRLQDNINKRHQLIQSAREFLIKKDFIEIETPLLTKSTPEGARDFIVPSRLQAGKFYALPQAPQQFKQLLMVSRFEKYFQIAKCLRDEDTRGDRQPEFTQLDLEMSFVNREDVMKLNEDLIIKIVEENYPDKKILQKPFPRLTYAEAMEKYKNDRPDLRENKDDPSELAFCWVIDFPFFEKDKNGKWTFTHNPFSSAMPEWEDGLAQKKDIEKIIASQYDIVLNGFEIGGGSIRNHKTELLKKVLEIIGLKEKEIQENFGHMLEAFEFGAPPHGGIAFGMDRIMAILQNEPNIREVIAFPKTGDGRDLMVEAPSKINKEQLKELGISIEEE